MSPRVLAVIPARAGSVRVPRKNHERLGDTSLVQLAYAAAENSCVCSSIVVSSDEDWPDMRTVPRPAHLCTPTSDIADATKHALDVLESYEAPFDYVITLQPATPLRSPQLIGEMLSAVVRTGADSAVTAARVVPWVWHVTGAHAENAWTPGPYPRSQDCLFQNLQEINTVQIASAATVRAGRRWALPLLLTELPAWATIDIDTPDDLVTARQLWSEMYAVFNRQWGFPHHLVTSINE